jgi:2-dehydropantoate 2-reductase
MKIAIVGAGGIGSTFAVQLARAGHEVTVVARRKRLAQLQQAAGIKTAAGDVIATHVSATLDERVPWDLVLVTVLASQVDALLPSLTASAAKRVMFMFNTFEPFERLRAAVGTDRFAFGFPSILARVDVHGALDSKVMTSGLLTTVTDRNLADMFRSAGVPAVTETDMESWLRCHAAAVAPIMLASAAAHERGAGISWTEASSLAAAMAEGFRLVRDLGHRVTPTSVALVSRLPRRAMTALIWIVTKNPVIRDSGAAGVGEARTLIDAMIAAAPNALPALLRVRPAGPG